MWVTCHRLVGPGLERYRNGHHEPPILSSRKESPRAAPCRPRTAGGQRRHQSAAVEQSAEALVPYEHVARKGQQRAAGILDRTIVQSRRVAGLARSCALLACSRLLQPGGGEARRVGADAINRRAILGDAILRLTANDGGVTPGRPADNRKRVQPRCADGPEPPGPKPKNQPSSAQYRIYPYQPGCSRTA